MVFEQNLFLSSAPVRLLNSFNKPENFTVRLTSPIKLKADKAYKVCLLNFYGVYSWHNIQSQSLNNIVRYSPDNGITWKIITIPDGVYSYSDINTYIHDVMKTNGDYTTVLGQDLFDINISFNTSSFLVYIELTNNYQFDLYTQQFGDLLGFDVAILTATTNTSSRLPNITNSIDTLYIHCSLVNDSIVNGKSSDVIYSFSTATLKRSYSFSFEPFNLVYSPISGNLITTITLTITDVNGTIIDLNGVDVSYTLQIKEMI
jgi:hypothetical protein